MNHSQYLTILYLVVARPDYFSYHFTNSSDIAGKRIIYS